MTAFPVASVARGRRARPFAKDQTAFPPAYAVGQGRPTLPWAVGLGVGAGVPARPRGGRKHGPVRYGLGAGTGGETEEGLTVAHTAERSASLPTIVSAVALAKVEGLPKVGDGRPYP